MDIVVFGNREFASLSWHALSNDSPHKVVGFTVDGDFLDKPTLHGLPVVAFEEIESCFDPGRVAMVMSIGWRQTNNLRASKSAEAEAKGYALITHISTGAIVWPDSRVGKGCIVFEGAIIQPFTRLGDGVIVRSGCNIAHHVEIGDFAFLGAHAVVGGCAHLGSRCFIGLNATVRDNIRIGERSIVGAGAFVARDAEPDAAYVAPPAVAKNREAGHQGE